MARRLIQKHGSIVNVFILNKEELIKVLHSGMGKDKQEINWSIDDISLHDNDDGTYTITLVTDQSEEESKGEWPILDGDIAIRDKKND